MVYIRGVGVSAECYHPATGQKQDELRRREGMPLNIIAAMLCAKPIVAAVNRGSRELVGHGENGFLFAEGNVTQLTEEIQSLKNNVLRFKMGQRGQEMARCYTVAAVKEELLPILLEE